MDAPTMAEFMSTYKIPYCNYGVKPSRDCIIMIQSKNLVHCAAFKTNKKSAGILKHTGEKPQFVEMNKMEEN